MTARCGNANCMRCRRRFARALRVPGGTRLATPGEKPVTAAALEAHVARYTGDKVPAEAARSTIAAALAVAAEHGLTLNIAKPPRERKSRGPSLRKRVAQLVADGYDAEQVAEIEDLTPHRARDLVRQAQAKAAK